MKGESEKLTYYQSIESSETSTCDVTTTILCFRTIVFCIIHYYEHGMLVTIQKDNNT